jgi:hypothetical protein
MLSEIPKILFAMFVGSAICGIYAACASVAFRLTKRTAFRLFADAGGTFEEAREFWEYSGKVGARGLRPRNALHSTDGLLAGCVWPVWIFVFPVWRALNRFLPDDFAHLEDIHHSLPAVEPEPEPEPDPVKTAVFRPEF